MDIHFNKILSFLLPLLFANHAVANNWQLIKNEEGTQIATRAYTGSAIKQFKASVRLNASLATVLAVLDDENAFPRWVHQCSEAKVLKTHSFAERYSYEKINLPFPIKDRIIITHSILQQDPQTKAVTITMNAAPQYCHKQPQNSNTLCKQINASTAIMVPKALGTYKLTPVANKNAVDLVWQQHSEAGGALPKWLINALLTDTPYYSLQGLKRRVQLEKYKHAKLVYNAENRITGFTPSSKKW
jgi:hypothetical protein